MELVSRTGRTTLSDDDWNLDPTQVVLGDQGLPRRGPSSELHLRRKTHTLRGLCIVHPSDDSLISTGPGLTHT